ncbi:MAG: DUF4349 domain-containing protein [Ignavibacteriales bacterium]|nr:DUF4349 domain-containing protein [Ignavibacteriales bacterium]
MKRIIQLLFISLLAISCHQEPSLEGYSDADIFLEEEIAPVTRQEAVNPPPPPMPPLKTKEVVKKKIIKDGRIGLKVTDLELTKAKVDSLVKQYSAYYSNENMNNSDWESSYNLTIRIPSSNFESFVHAIQSGNGEILYKEIDARDVTDQFIDLEIRLENKRAYLKRYQELLKKATNVKEILEVEEKIRRLEEEIESTTGKLKYLSDLVDYSTLNLNIRQQKDFKYNPEKRDSFSERIKQSLSKGWYGFIDFLLLLIKIWPFWFIGIFIIYFYRELRRKKKLNK